MRKRVLTLFMAVYLLVLLLPAIGLAQEVRVLWFPVMAGEPWFVAQDKGMLAKRGIKIKATMMWGLAKQFEAMLGNSADIAMATTLRNPMEIAERIGVTPKMVYPLNWIGTFKGKYYGPQSFIVVRADSTIKKVADLKGKNIAVLDYNSLNAFILKEQLNRVGINPEREVKILRVPLPRHESVLISGSVHAAVMLEPFAHIATKKGTVKVISSNIAAIFPEDMLIAQTWTLPRFVEKNPDKLRRIQAALAEAVNFMNNPKNHPERFKILAKWTKLKMPVISDLATSTQYFKPYPKGFTDWHLLEPQIDLFVKYGLVKKKINARAFDPWK